MKNEKYLIIFLLISVVGVILYYELSDNDPSTIRSFEKEYRKSVASEQAKIKAIRKKYDSIVWRMYNDSLVTSALLKSYNEEIKRLKRNAKKIDLRNANPAMLDSITTSLYPAEPER